MRDVEEKILKGLEDDIKILKRANFKTDEIIDHIKNFRDFSNDNTEEYKKEITIYYKDSAQDEYVTRRVLTQDGNYYKLTSYWKKGKNIERYESRLKLTKSEANKYIIQCRKEDRFDHFEYQFVM